ncbi:MAG TPA: putative peptidoglycan glycosyltransferase FtsW, partial [Abditibacteriaceae bacterium]
MRPPIEAQDFSSSPEAHPSENQDAVMSDVALAAARRARLTRQREQQQEKRQRLARRRWQEKARHGGRLHSWADLSDDEREALVIQREQAAQEREAARAAREAEKLRRCPPAHWGLTAVTLILTLLSIPLIYSASAAMALEQGHSVDFYFIRQLVYVSVGLGALFVASLIHPAKLPRLVKWLYGAAFIGLVLIKFSPLGKADEQGIERWLKLGPAGTFQVSELAKIALIGVVALYWSKLSLRERRDLSPWLIGWLLAVPLMGLVFLQPHLSAAMMLFILPCGIAFFAGAPWQRMAQVGGVMAAFAALVVVLCVMGKCPGLKEYQQERIRAFVVRHSETDAAQKKQLQDANYQAEQGMNALRRGGLIGAGPGASFYKHGHTPEPYTDFILAIIGEEWGLVGTLALLTAFGALIFFCFQIGHNASNSFESLFCAGVGSLLAIQVVANTGVVAGLLPVTGVVLPLVSFGGSGLIVMLFAIGIVLGISRRQCDL